MEFILTVPEAWKGMARTIRKCPYVKEVISEGFSGGSTSWDFYIASSKTGEEVRDWLWDNEEVPSWMSIEELN